VEGDVDERKDIQDMTPDEIAGLDERPPGEEHPAEMPAMVENDDGVIDEDELGDPITC
jgi:hypothetical protein